MSSLRFRMRTKNPISIQLRGTQIEIRIRAWTKLLNRPSPHEWNQEHPYLWKCTMWTNFKRQRTKSESYCLNELYKHAWNWTSTEQALQYYFFRKWRVFTRKLFLFRFDDFKIHYLLGQFFTDKRLFTNFQMRSCQYGDYKTKTIVFWWISRPLHLSLQSIWGSNNRL